MTESFGVICKCAGSNSVEESLEEQVSWLFHQGNKEENLAIIKILGPYFWFGGYVLDRVEYENLFGPIMQILGYALNTNGIVRHTVREENISSVMTTLDQLEMVLVS